MKISKLPNIKSYLAVLVIILCSCSTSHLTYIGKDSWIDAMSMSAMTTNDLSYKSRYFLVENDLMNRFQKNPQEVIKQLAEYIEDSHNNPMAIRKENITKVLSVLVELCTYKARNSSKNEAIKYWMSSCFYSYKYLFDKSVITALTPYNSLEYAADIRFYNYALSNIAAYFADNNIMLESSHEFPLVIGKVRLSKARSDLLWPLEKFDSFVNGYDYLPKNLQSHSYVSGLGVPILGIQKYDSGTKLNKELAIISLVYPFTFLMRFENFDLRGGSIDAVPELFDSFNNEFVKIDNNKIPLSKDYSLALAKVTDSYPKKISGFKYMLNPDKMGDLQGLYMLAPYNRDKIPVVLVHGLMSSPEIWLEMLNTLLNNRSIRENYQFWVYAYPTGDPVYYSAFKFRSALMEVKNKYTRNTKNQKFNEMVIIGHSMGGLLTRLSIQSSNGYELIEKITSIKIDNLKLNDAQRKFLIDVGLFQPLPFIKSVVLISTPNKGSKMATFTLARIGSYLISLPLTVVQHSRSIIKQVAVASGLKEDDFTIPNGIDQLAPTSKFIQIAYELPVKKDVEVHSIIGNEDQAGEKSGSDGVVLYSSAHLPYAQSELVIKSDHSAYDKPECIKEVLRILLEHLQKCNINLERSF
jgi:pimeloyl-ACP methyl ester carboxylesterase